MATEVKVGDATVLYEIGSSIPENGMRIVEDFYAYNPREMRFLEEYAKDLDVERALKDAGYSDISSAKSKLLRKGPIQQEMSAICEARFKAMRMTSEMAAARHIDLMNKIERDYDNSDNGDKAKFANALSKFSGDYLRGAGMFSKDQKSSTAVVVNIKIGDDKVVNAVEADYEVVK